MTALFGAGSRPASKAAANGIEEAVQAGANGAKDGAGHLEERDGKEKRENLEGETNDDTKHASGR